MSYQLTGNVAVSSEVGVILPTYREAENIAKLIAEIENLSINTSILVIDDSSPDTTAEIVKNLQKKYGNILLCVRPEKSGLGTAITDGFKIFLSLKNSPRFVVTMDADYSHNPEALLHLLSTMCCGCGIAIGSRYCKGGKTVGWPFTRKLISRAANAVAKSIVGFKLNDCTSGFRCYSTNFLKEAIGIEIWRFEPFDLICTEITFLTYRPPVLSVPNRHAVNRRYATDAVGASQKIERPVCASDASAWK